MNKETRRKDSARSDLRRGCKRKTSSELVSRKKKETLCSKERTGLRKKDTQSKTLLIEKRIRSILIIWKEECGVCVDFNTKNNNNEAQETVEPKLLVVSLQQGSNDVTVLIQKLPRRGNKETCVGNLEISRKEIKDNTQEGDNNV